MVVRFENVTKIYSQPVFLKSKKILGLKDLNLDIKEGEIFGLLGLNGNGKTTALRLLLGLIKPTSGKVVLEGSRGYLPEDIAFPPKLTSSEILKFLSFGKRSSLEISEALNTVGLFSLKQRPVGGFSKGMIQRLGIAQAVVDKPRILVLDEPTSGLDPMGVVEMRELFLKLNQELEITILFSSHVISEVEKISHRVGILAENRLKLVLTRDSWLKESLEGLFVDAIKN